MPVSLLVGDAETLCFGERNKTMAKLFGWFLHGAFAGGLGGISVKDRDPIAGIVFLLFFAGTIYGGVKQGWGILVPDAIGFVLGFTSVIKS